MPTIGSETYSSNNPLETRDKSTYSSRKPPELIHGPDYPVISMISELSPAELPVSDPDTEVTVTGTNFNDRTVIVWNGGDELTDFVDSEHVKTTVKPSTVEIEPPFSLPVQVRNDEILSNTLTFTFTKGIEANEEPEEEAKTQEEAGRETQPPIPPAQSEEGETD
jgi:IPT/TIG domain